MPARNRGQRTLHRSLIRSLYYDRNASVEHAVASMFINYFFTCLHN